MKHVVGVADMRISTAPGDVLVTHGLGSCLGVSLWDPGAHVGGLLHVMMPVSSANPEKARANPYMFVDTGVPTFIDELCRAGADRRRFTCKVAGGSMVHRNDHFAIGKRNYVTLKKLLWKTGILIDSEDVGGSIPRTMYVDVGSGRVWLINAGRQWNL